MSGAVQRNLWNPGESFRISEESLGLNETKGNSCGIFKNKILVFSKEKSEREQTGRQRRTQGANLKFGRLRE